MLIRSNLLHMLPVYILIFVLMISVAVYTDRSAMTIGIDQTEPARKTVVIDPGHGGVDGGATSCTGILESKYNLEISLRLRDLLNLLGIRTVMIRTVDESVYTDGETIAAKKISDLKERVRIVNSIQDAILVSIHQNYFPNSKYYGPQVFFASTEGSKYMAELLQNLMQNTISPHNHRMAKKADGIYLMQHINCTGILIECGFLSNIQEEALLRSDIYQRKLCCVIAAMLSQTIYNT